MGVTSTFVQGYHEPISPSGTAGGSNLAKEAENGSLIKSIFSLLSDVFFLSPKTKFGSAKMNSWSPHTLSLMPSGSDHHLRPEPSRRTETANAIPINSHYHDLRQLECEEDLIELGSEPPTPRTQTDQFDVPTHGSGGDSSKSSQGLKRSHAKLYVISPLWY